MDGKFTVNEVLSAADEFLNKQEGVFAVKRIISIMNDICDNCSSSDELALFGSNLSRRGEYLAKLQGIRDAFTAEAIRRGYS